MTRLLTASLVVALAGTAAAFGQAQTPVPAAKPMDYETYCSLPDLQAKREAFRVMTPEERAVVVRTQVERWRDANKARLSPEQLAYLAEMLTLITKDTYAEGPAAEAAREKARAFTAKQTQLFTPADMQAMQPNAPCIAKSVSRSAF